MPERRWAGLVALILCALAFAVSYYLFNRGNALATTGAQTADFCSEVFDASCDDTLTSPYSRLFGLSFAGWGAIYYATLALLVLMSSMMRTLIHRQALTAAVLVNVGGLVISGYLVWLMLAGHVSRCPLCFVTHVLNVALLPVLLLFRGGGIRSIGADLTSGFNHLFASRNQGATENTARTLAFVAVLLFAVVAYEWFLLKSKPAQATAGSPRQIIDNIMQAYMDEPIMNIPAGPDDMRQGSPNAPLQLVVFSDYECPSCKANELRLERITAAFGSRLSIVFKHAPLSSDCNPNVNANPHPYACGAAYAAIAAHMQGKFLPFHHALFQVRGDPTPQAIQQIAARVGLDLEKFERDRQSDAVRERLRQDIDLARQLKVVLTPSMFLNGRALNAATAMHIGIIGEELLRTGDRGPQQ